MSRTSDVGPCSQIFSNLTLKLQIWEVVSANKDYVQKKQLIAAKVTHIDLKQKMLINK